MFTKAALIKTVSRFVSLFGAFLLLFLASAFAEDAPMTISILGDVVGSGGAEMKGAYNRWIPLSGKTYPLIDGTHLRTHNGTLSLLFKDTARMELGGNADILLSGPVGTYKAVINNGNAGFTAPNGSSFSVSTPNATVQTIPSAHAAHHGDSASLDTVRGVIRYDGKGTMIIGITGTFILQNAQGGEMQTVRAGDAVYVAQDGTRRVIPVQHQTAPGAISAAAAVAGRRGLLGLCGTIVTVEETGNTGRSTDRDASAQNSQATGGVPTAVAIVGRSIGILPICFVGTAVLIEAGTYAIVNDKTKVTGVASPSGFNIQ